MRDLWKYRRIPWGLYWILLIIFIVSDGIVCLVSGIGMLITVGIILAIKYNHRRKEK